jgi:hypothetical protein
LPDVKLRRLLFALSVLGLSLPGRAAPAKSTNVPPADAFALRPLEWIRQFPAPRLLPAWFPRDVPVRSVEHLAFAGPRLWLAVRPRAETNLAAGSGRLWAFSPEVNRLEVFPGAITNETVTGLVGQGGQIWLAVDGGVATIDATALTIRGFGQPQGLVATNFVGLELLDGGLATLSRNGGLFTLSATATNFSRATGPVPAPNRTAAESWNIFAASKHWVLAGAGTNLVLRNTLGPQWLPGAAELDRGSPRLSPPRVQCAEGDGEGGFWIGTDAGLHWLDSETGQMENRFAPLPLKVPGGMGVKAAPGFQLTAAAYRQAQDRVMNGVRERMRDRARRARAVSEGRSLANWVQPTSRLPGPVTALLRDQTWLWVACADFNGPQRSRILLYHRPSRRWVGWFPLGLPVRSLAADSRNLWVGMEDAAGGGVPVLVAVDKLPLISQPQGRWTRETISPEELGQRLAALGAKERAVYAFFAGDPAKVVELLAPDGTPAPGADAESLFLLAFAHDSLGLNQPDRMDGFLSRLRSAYPDSLFTELTAQVRPRLAAPAPPPAEEPKEPETAEAVMERRDLNGDGKLNAVELRLWLGAEAPVAPADSNGDGVWDRTELAAWLAQRKP